MANDTHNELHDYRFACLTLAHAATASHLVHSDLLLQTDLTKCERKRKRPKLKKRVKEQQLKDNYLLEKAHNFHKVCTAVRKTKRENEWIPCSVNVKPLL